MLVDNELKKAKALIKKQQLSEARAVLEKILSRYPENGRALETYSSLNLNLQSSTDLVLGRQLDSLTELYNKGLFIRVVELANELTSCYPDCDQLWNLLGATNKRLNRKEQALEAFQKVVNLRPLGAGGLNNLGIALCDLDHGQEALKTFSTAIALNPKYSEAHFNRGNTLLKMERFVCAIKSFKTAIAIKNNYPKAHNNLGVAYHKNGEFQKAVKALESALLLFPAYPEALNNLANAFEDLGRLEEAIDALSKALSIKPDYFDAMKNMGNVLQSQGEYDRAICAYSEGLRLSPGCPEISNNLGQLYLKLGDFEKGTDLFEHRFNTKSFSNQKITISKPAWAGQISKNILVLAEQGIGDEIMYASMLNELHSYCSDLVIQTDPRLKSLFERSFHNKLKIIDDLHLIDESQFDFQISLGSLMKYLRPNFSSFRSSSEGYLVSCQKQVKEFKKQLSGFGVKKILGISWKTASPATGSHHRNIDIIDLVRGLQSQDTVLINLQYGDVTNDIQKVKKDLDLDIVQLPGLDLYQNIDGLASLIFACDEIITVDNLNIHLAGALGKRANLLLPFNGDWRWGQAGTTSYWYDSVNVARQSKPNDWSYPIDMLRRH